VFRQRPCDELITRPRALPSVKNDYGTELKVRALNGLEEPLKNKLN
jgi:hypothetical protein